MINRRVTGKTRIIGILGNPVEHSLSPQLHNTISDKLGIDIIYIPFNVEKSNLADAVKGLKALNVLGFNVTIPYKRDIMKYIDDNIRETFLMGAINTVKNIEGRFYGYNTDGEGFIRSFKDEAGVGFKGKKVVLIGAGGVARSIAVKINQEGASKISLVNRTPEKAVDIAEIVNENMREIVQVYNFGDKTLEEELKNSEIIINATSTGMYPDIEASPMIDYNCLQKGQFVYDVIYSPKKTKFLQNAEQKGCKVINGLGMLFYQGIQAYEIWTGIKLTDEFLADIYNLFINLESGRN